MYEYLKWVHKLSSYISVTLPSNLLYVLLTMVLWGLIKFVPHLECGQGEETLIVQLATPIL